MRAIFCVVCLLLVVVASVAQASVSQATMLFLAMSPSAQANGRTVAVLPGSYDDPLAPWYNPAALGFLARQSKGSIGFGYVNRIPQFGLRKNLTLTGLAANASLGKLALPQFLGRRPALYYGVGAHLVSFNLNDSPVTDEQGHNLGTFRVHEWVSAISLGVMLDYYVHLAVGGSLKSAHSTFAATGSAAVATEVGASTSMGDVGALLEIPLLSLVENIRHARFQAGENLHPDLYASFGYAMTNIGGKVSYTDLAQADPLPRTARAAFGLTADLTRYDPVVGPWKMVSLSYGVQGEDELIWRDASGVSGYIRAPFGDMHVVDDLLLGKSNARIRRLSGGEVTALEALTVRAGYYEDPEDALTYHSYGLGLRLSGILKVIHRAPATSPTGFQKILRHVDVQYDACLFDGADRRVSSVPSHLISVRVN
ncbi:MAG TPA: hypothetical protein VGL38_07050 [bacterium]|jgi:hypothetical protein